MKIERRYLPSIFAGIYALISIGLPWLIFIPLMAFQGSASGVIADRIIILVNWPSFLLGIYPKFVTQSGREVIEFTLTDPKVYLVNAIGWGLIGYILGLIISFAKARRMQRVNSDAKE